MCVSAYVGACECERVSVYVRVCVCACMCVREGVSMYVFV